MARTKKSQLRHNLKGTAPVLVQLAARKQLATQAASKGARCSWLPPIQPETGHAGDLISDNQPHVPHWRKKWPLHGGVQKLRSPTQELLRDMKQAGFVTGCFKNTFNIGDIVQVCVCVCVWPVLFATWSSGGERLKSNSVLVAPVSFALSDSGARSWRLAQKSIGVISQSSRSA
jgi:hypothetical protein